MNAEMMAKLVVPTKPDGTEKSKSEIFREINTLIDINNIDSREKIIEQDIRYTEFLEQFVIDQTTKDIVFVSTFFHQAYSILFISIQLMKKEPNEGERTVITKTFEALTRLGKPDLLTNGLSKQIINKYCKK